MFAHVLGRSGFDNRSGQARLLASIPSGYGYNREQLVWSWAITTKDCGVKERGRMDYAAGGTNYTTRGSVAVSAGAMEIAIVIQSDLEVFWLYQWTIVDERRSTRQYLNRTYWVIASYTIVGHLACFMIAPSRYSNTFYVFYHFVLFCSIRVFLLGILVLQKKNNNNCPTDRCEWRSVRRFRVPVYSLPSS